MLNNRAHHYIALLRGINVGGNHSIKMVNLKTCFESMGYADVLTYIQSGNVIFSSKETDKEVLTKKIENTLKETFGFLVPVVVVSATELKKTVTDAPKGFGEDQKKYRYDVFFLKNPLTAAEVLEQISVKEGVDSVAKGVGVVYFSRVIEKATQSYLPKVITLPIYKQMTIRNWNTTTKLLSLLEK